MEVQVEGDYMTGAGIYADETGQGSRVTFEAHRE
jgi:hypothetical protein